MKIKILVIAGLIFFTGQNLSSQDAFHYTLFDFTESAMNPALAGAFEGTARLGGLYREQDYGLQIGQYRNPVVYVDAPIIRGFGKYDWIGIGMNYIYDQQRFDEFEEDTNVDLITTKVFGGLAYHLVLDKKYKNVLSFGIQSGSASTYFSTPDIVTWSEFGNDPHSDPVENALPIKNPSGEQSGSSGRTNWVGGISFRSTISKESKLSVGVSVANIGRASNSISGQGGFSRAPMRYLVHAQYMTPIAEKVFIEPRVFFQYMEPSWDMSAQAMAHFLLNPEKNTKVGAGLGYNIQNGLQFLLSTEFKGFRIGYSFDLNLTDKTAVSGAASAFELGVSYILKFYKKPKPEPVLLCPRI